MKISGIRVVPLVGSVLFALVGIFASPHAGIAANYYSAQNPTWPPLPANILGLPQAEISPGLFVIDDENINYVELQQQSAILNALESVLEGPPAPPGAGEGGGGGLGGGGDNFQWLYLSGSCGGKLRFPVYQGTNVVLSLTNAGSEPYELLTTTAIGTNWTYLGRWTNAANPWVIANPSASESYYTVGCTNDSDRDFLSDIFETFVTRSDTNSIDTDYDGCSDYEEAYFSPNEATPCAGEIVGTIYQTNATNAAVFRPKQLIYLDFNSANYVGSRGQQPMATNNLQLADAWITKGVQLTDGAARLIFQTVETNDWTANLNLRSGSVRFWFKPQWNSGSGPAAGRLLEVGTPNSAGWWSLFFGSQGSQILFASQTNGAAVATNLVASVTLTSNRWCQITLTYTSGEVALYTNGVPCLTNAAGFAYPGWEVRTNGFALGCALAGGSVANGVFEDLETFNYPLSPADILANYEYTRPPDHIGNLQQWLIAAIVHTNAPDRVDLWPDQSGNKNHALANSGERPYWIGNGVNGRPVVRFDGNSLFTTNLRSYVTNWTQAEGFIVLKADSDRPNLAAGVWRIGVPGNPAHPSTSGEIVDNFGSASATFNVGSIAQGLTNFHLYNPASRQGEWAARLNGILKFQTASNAVGFSPTSKLGQGGNKFVGDVAEVLIFNRALSLTERDCVTHYLHERYQFMATPQTPTNLTINVLAPTQVSVWWNPGANDDQTTYFVERTMDGKNYSTVARAEGASFIDGGLATNTVYQYRVRAWNLAGPSAYSCSQVITSASSGVAMPLDPATLKLWLKSDSAALANYGGTINQWRDESGNTNLVHYPSSESHKNRPYLVAITNALNNHFGLRFFGTNWFEIRFAQNLNSWTNAEVFAAIRARREIPLASGPGLWRFGGVGGGEYYPSTTGVVQDDFFRSAVLSLPSPPTTITNFHLFNISSRQSEWVARFNSHGIYTNIANTVTVPDYYPLLGNGQNPFDGEIIEVMLFNKVSTDLVRAVISEYFRRKYNLWENN